MKKVLAIHGGRPVLKKPWPTVYNIGKEEIAAVSKLLKKGPLSDFIGVKGEYFFGGKEALLWGEDRCYAKKNCCGSQA